MKPGRVSVFREVGLLDDDCQLSSFGDIDGHIQPLKPPGERHGCIDGEMKRRRHHDNPNDRLSQEKVEIPGGAIASNNRGRLRPLLARTIFIAALSLYLTNAYSGFDLMPRIIPAATGSTFRDVVTGRTLQKRDNSPTNVCKRWSQQSAIINGTLYLYGGRATLSSSQTNNEWNLTKSWQISSPPLSGLPLPSGPPAIANGYLWSSTSSLYLFGGEYSDNPKATPDPFSLWEYRIASSSWIQHSNPSTSAGTNSEPSGESVQRAAEGAGFSVSALGRGWYFGGHLDSYTTPGWSDTIPRLYLKSFIEYTFPGGTNPAINGISGPAGSDGAWRNITQAGIQDLAGFTERADGLLVYIPGFGASGVLLSLAGGTNDTFTQMNEVDVYDIATSNWYSQATNGPTPEIRVNPCAVVAAADDGSSYQVYMYGGQNLIPYGNQTQYADMWILSVPSFTWIPINTSQQSTPYARAGHTCDVWDGQMIVIGGYIDPAISCESPGIYVFDLSKLQWVNAFTALSDGSPKNPFSQQASQEGTGTNAGLHGSFGYAVPPAVYSVIGGAATGGATITAPMAQATAGPLATGHAITYTVTDANGGTITETAAVVPGAGGGRANVGAAAAGAVAGVLALLAGYLAFCAVLYRKQLRLYQERHAAMLAAARESGASPAGAPESAAAAAKKKRASAWGNRAGWVTAGAFAAAGKEGAATDPGSRWSDGTACTGAGMRPASGGNAEGLTGSAANSSEDLLGGFEPSYWGVLLHPRRSLKVVNR